MRPLPLEPAAQEGGPCPGLMTRFLPSADSDPGEGSEGFCSETFAPCPPKPELCSRDEVLYILEMLCTALLVSKPLDLEGVKYLMWVCRHLKVRLLMWMGWGVVGGTGMLGLQARHWG